MTALLFGSISSVADTSELQRESFNEAFAEHGLDWHWDRDDYRSLSGRPAARPASPTRRTPAARTSTPPPCTPPSRASSRRSCARRLRHLAPVCSTRCGRPRASGWKTGFVTTTSRDNVLALLDALAARRPPRGLRRRSSPSDQVDTPKPDPAAYAFALTTLGEDAGAAVAIEDNADGVRAAAAAGVTCVAFPNENTAGGEFPEATRRLDRLTVDDLTSLTAA